MRIHGYIKEVFMVHFFFFIIFLNLWNGLHWFMQKIAAYSCSMEICLNSNSEKKSRYIDYFMHRINLLRYHKITPVVVFDGANIPCKAATENERYRFLAFLLQTMNF